MPRYDRTCEDCGEPFYTFIKTTKYCQPCRILRDRFHSSRKCAVCGVVFWPIRRSYYECYKCTFPPNKGEHPCNICGLKNRTAPGLTQTCVDCIQKDEAAHKKYILTLKKRKVQSYSKLA